jgi:hypothetical protein
MPYWIISFSVGLWLSWVGLDTTDTFSCDGSDSNETIFTPAWSPRILNDVVFNCFTVNNFRSITYCSDSVVMRGSAFCISDNSTSVSMENWLVSLYRNMNGSNLESSLKLINGVDSHVLVSSDQNFTFRNIVSTSLILCNVWVIFKKLNWVLLRIFVSKLNITSIAASITFGVAINKL